MSQLWITIKKTLKVVLESAGFELKRIQTRSTAHSTMLGSLVRLKAIGIEPTCIVDVGAASGKWTLLSMSQWPNSKYLLMEPLEEHRKLLEELMGKNSNVSWYQGVAGKQERIVNFNVSPDLDGSGIYGSDGANVRSVSETSIDVLLGNRIGPFLLKLDTHGYEVPILEGCRKVLLNTAAIIIEVYGFQVSPTGLLFHQQTAYMESLGFRLFDLVDVMRRRTDGAFWQADAVFLRSDHPVFKSNKYAG